MKYTELQCASHFSFLRGASSCEELFQQAAILGIGGLAIADRNSLAGIVRAHEAARQAGVRLIVGCRIDLNDGSVILLYPTDRAAYSRLCRLLSVGKSRGGKGKCDLAWEDLTIYGEGQVAILIPDLADDLCALRLRRLREIYGARAHLALTLRRRPNDALRLHELSNLAAREKVPSVVTNDVLFHIPKRRLLQDVMSCIRHGCSIDEAGFRRERHADRYLKSPIEMARLFSRYPDALARTAAIAEECRFSLDELSYQYPEEVNIPGQTPQQHLRVLTWEGAKQRYPDGVPDKVIGILRHELTLIEKLEYAPYFLTVHAIVRFARGQGILCQGRGSAANSAVCFVLGITSIDPMHHDLLFERFVSEERREPPDIDVDFEHERREIVMQWIFEHYGRDHAALCATVIRYRAKAALRDVGKALGLPEDLISTLATEVRGWGEDAPDVAALAEIGLDPTDRRLRLVLELAGQLIGMPRHLSQHPGGFVLTHDRLNDLVPIEPAAMADRQVIEWDKDDIDALKFMKVDCLALGMLSCVRRSFDLLAARKHTMLELASIPPEDARTYQMIQKADTVGVFQIESRAQMAMLPRLKPRCFYDLVIEVALVRPGPIQGDMVHPYLRRRDGLEKVEYPSPELQQVLQKTLGVPLFQEQAMRVAIVGAGFSGSEADQLRRAMATFKNTGTIGKFRDKLIDGMVARGYGAEFAARTFAQLEGFGSYGFPESHAASFALIAYASAWLKCHHPDVFCAALLNSQPMGFYAPAQIVRDARDHGIEVRPVCVNASRWDCTLEADGSRFAVRLGLRLVKGFANADAARLCAMRGERDFATLDDVWRRTAINAASLVILAEADAFLPAFKLARREALWAIKALRDEPLPLFAAAARAEQQEPRIALRAQSEGSEVVEDYIATGLSLRRHPLEFLRAELAVLKISPCSVLQTAKDGMNLGLAGLVLMRQRPGTARGVMFITLEDETGIANLVIWPQLYEAERRVIHTAKLLMVRGYVQREGDVVHVIARKLEDFSAALGRIGEGEVMGVRSRDFR